jgi:hypothetical protein
MGIVGSAGLDMRRATAPPAPVEAGGALNGAGVSGAGGRVRRVELREQGARDAGGARNGQEQGANSIRCERVRGDGCGDKYRVGRTDNRMVP